jgi:phosphoglucomutase
MTPSERIQAARTAGRLLPTTADNLNAFLGAGLPAWAQAAIEELLTREAWGELNDRFYRFLEFGTGGMRGRTIGALPAAAETGAPTDPWGGPEHAAIGSNMMNDLTLIRATIGLFRYTEAYRRSRGETGPTRLVIAYDVRFFSRHFCELAASTWTKLGGLAFIFNGCRPTPQLSFSVRWLNAHAGIVITASHNPPHDNGFKAYFDDGAQVIPPHDRGIVDQVNAVPLKELGNYLDKSLDGVAVLGWDADDAYLSAAAKAVIDPAMLREHPVHVAFTSIHGTGAVHGMPLLVHAGCIVHAVREQVAFDPRFPTVQSPNPENAAALALAVALAEKDDCDVVLATDPDCDRMGAAVRSRQGRMELVTGNQIGALLADYRLRKYKELGWIPAAGSERACIIKTFVTTQLQDAIGRAHGVRVVNTLTGFKWIAAKLRGYEERLAAAVGPDLDYGAASLEERARLQLEQGSFFVFGTEESYGYLPNDAVRDKDGNAACMMFAELCAWVKSRGITVPEYLDEIFLRCGFYLEGVINIYYEGASGSAKIRRILETYRARPPGAFGAVKVTGFQDFGRERILDADGEEIPKQDLYLIALDNGCTVAARGSGTEPKMKFYLFAHEDVGSPAELPRVKDRVRAMLDGLSKLIEADARARAEG